MKTIKRYFSQIQHGEKNLKSSANKIPNIKKMCANCFEFYYGFTALRERYLCPNEIKSDN